MSICVQKSSSCYACMRVYWLVDNKTVVMALSIFLDRFAPVWEKYKALEKFEISVPDAELELLDTLEPKWAGFQGMLDSSAATLDRSKENFR